MKNLICSFLILMGSVSWAGSPKTGNLGSIKSAIRSSEEYSSRVQEFLKRTGEKSKVYEIDNTSYGANKVESKSLFVHDPQTGEAAFQMQKKDGSGYQGQIPLGKMDYNESISIHSHEVNGALNVTTIVTKPLFVTSSKKLSTQFTSMPVYGQTRMVPTRRQLHMDHPQNDPRIYTEKTISIADGSKKIRVSNLTLHRFKNQKSGHIQTNAIAEIPNPIPNSKVVDIQIDSDNKVIAGILDKDGTLHTLNYRFVEELNHDLSKAKPNTILTNRARLVPDETRSPTVFSNAVKNGRLTSEVDVIPSPQTASVGQNVSNMNLTTQTPASAK